MNHSPTATCGLEGVLVTETQWRVSNAANSEGGGYIGSVDSVSALELHELSVKRTDEPLSLIECGAVNNGKCHLLL